MKKLNIKTKLKNKFIPSSQKLIIEMELITGEKVFEEVIIKKDKFFIYNAKTYLIHPRYLHFNKTFQRHVGNYHVSCSLPLKHTVSVQDIKQVMLEDAEFQETANNIDPSILTDFINSTVIQKVLAGAEMDKTLTLIKLGVIVIGIVSVINLIINMGSSGLF